MSKDTEEYLLLKWGTLKGWDIKGETTLGLMEAYLSIGASSSAMTQQDTTDQKVLICQMIDRIDGPIHNDWTGEELTKDEAKKYVAGYRT